MRIALLLLFVAMPIRAQWQILDGRTTANLRGVSNVGGGVVWVSGDGGTVLRSEDDGYMWQGCTVPTGAEKLDFRGIQAFDKDVAIVMSSGPGDASRLYKTTDGCQTWKLVFTNPDKEGFWDAVVAADAKLMMLMGDPVNGSFRIFETWDGGNKWTPEETQSSVKDEGGFAASNSSLAVGWVDGVAVFGTGSPSGARLFSQCDPCLNQKLNWTPRPMAMFPKAASAGIFSIFQSDWKHLVAVGGDYKKPDGSEGTAAFSIDGGKHWIASRKSPHGYRSAVAYDAATKVWITVGPNGTDVSLDDGRSWRAARPDMSLPGAQADEDAKWNALSLPFVVGPKGRIGKWRGLVIATASR